MKIEKLKLENFRVYYGNQEILFSSDDDKNVTLCLAKNNGGKTTLAQSIVWCLYGVLNLKEPDEILNKEIKLAMKEGESRTVAVTLELLHRGEKYIIRREQVITKTRLGHSKDNSKQTIITFNEDNDIVDASNIDINEILPRSLSRFFIFDGERMLHMGRNDDIHKEELEKDIRNILGLDVLEEAINHLGGKSGNGAGGVLASLTSQIDNGNDGEILRVQQDLKDISGLITTFDEQMKENHELQKIKQSELNEIKDFLEAHELVKQKQIERASLESEVAALNERKEKLKTTFLKKSSEALPLLLVQKLFNETITFASNSSDLGEAAPDITSATIDYILEKSECICGTKFNMNDRIYHRLCDSKRLYPPESIGTAVKRYLDAIKSTAKSNEETRTSLDNLYEEYLVLDSDILTRKSKLDTISRNMQESTEEKIREADKQYNVLVDELKVLNEIYLELKTLQKLKVEELTEKEAELDALSTTTDNNKRIKNYKDVAKDILSLFKKIYSTEEEKVRNDLQQEVQSVYDVINRGKGRLDINKKFEFVLHTEINGQFVKDDSKGQGLSTVAAFAFVCGITKLVREKLDDEELYRNEPYPLIIDAPYSAMDTDYIEKVSEVLPRYAEQLIIMVKDDNFETAKRIFDKNSVIGNEYVIALERNATGVENQFRTRINQTQLIGADSNV
jgi:DNA sulfur modification protein DndD